MNPIQESDEQSEVCSSRKKEAKGTEKRMGRATCQRFSRCHDMLVAITIRRS